MLTEEMACAYCNNGKSALLNCFGGSYGVTIQYRSYSAEYMFGSVNQMEKERHMKHTLLCM